MTNWFSLKKEKDERCNKLNRLFIRDLEPFVFISNVGGVSPFGNIRTVAHVGRCNI